jgi:hypothetical protein
MAVLVPEGWESFDGGATSCEDVSVAASGDLDCRNGGQTVTLTASGGVPPYTWDTDVGIVTAINATQAELTPAANPGSATSGIAYAIAAKYAGVFCDCVCQNYNCDDSPNGGCVGFGCNICWLGSCSCATCAGGADALFKIVAGDPCHQGKPTVGSACAGLESYHRYCDKRTGGQISAGCNPCGLSMEGGAVVTVTDSLGNEAFVAVDSL